MPGLHVFLDEFVAEALQEWSQPGAALAVFRRGEAAYRRGFGVRRLDGSAAVDAETWFALASCSKTFAAISVGLLVDDGALSFDERVVDILPGFALSEPEVTAQLTVRDLLCNRVGITSSEDRHRQVAADRRDLLRRLRYHRFRHPFRAQYGYCTDAFTIIGEIVTARAGMDWARFVRDRLWLPLGMTRTNANHGEAQSGANHAWPHLRRNGALVPVPWIYEDHVATPAGGVNSCARDLASWLAFLAGDGPAGPCRLLSAAAFGEILRLHTVETGEFADDEFAAVLGHGEDGVSEPGYGLGLYLHRYRGTRVCYHCGSIDGFRSVVGFLPQLDAGVAVTVNADSRYFAKMLFQAAIDRLLGDDGRYWHDAFAAAERTFETGQSSALPPAASERPDWLAAGRYVDRTGFGEVVIREEGEAAVLCAGALEYELRPLQDGDVVAIKRWPYAVPPQFRLYPDSGADGRLRGLATDQGAYFACLPGPAAAVTDGSRAARHRD